MDFTDHHQRNPIEKLAEEFMRRRRNGEAPTIDEYVQRYPDRANEIRELFPTLQLMANVRDDVANAPAAQDLVMQDERIGEWLGDYRLLREIGRGGMGIIYEADQESLGRRVALKVLSPELVRSSKYLERFQREARAAASLQHTNIVPVFGVGEEQGAYYYVMQFIHGRGMDEIMAALQTGLPSGGIPDGEDSAAGLAAALETGQVLMSAELVGSTERSTVAKTAKLSGRPMGRSIGSSGSNYCQRIAEIGAHVADALAYAHRRGILHRDIKPSNLMFDVTGNVWVTDFGLAKIEGEKDLTATGDLVGTLRYIAPESLRGQFDARGDVYGLGLTLYELVTRQSAFSSKDRGELVRQISEEGPPQVSRHSGIPRDLETIIHKAIERDPQDRYSSAERLADDLRRFLTDKPIQARRPTLAQRVTKWSRRHRPIVAMTAVVFAMAMAGLVLSNFLVVQQRNSAQARLVRLTIANGIRHLEAGDSLSSLPWFVEALRLDHNDPTRERLHRVRIRSTLSQCPKLVWMWFHEAPVTFETGTLDLKLSTNAEFSPDGRFVVAPSGNMKARVWDTTTGEVVHVLSHSLPLLHAGFSSDGRMVATASGDLRGGREGFAIVWDATTGKQITPPLAHDDAVLRVWFSPDGGRLVTASLDRTARVWDARTGEPITAPMQHESRVNAVAFSPDGQSVVTASQGWRIWDSKTGEPRTPPLNQSGSMGVYNVSFSPDGSRIVTAGENSQIWETASGKLLATLPHTRNVWHAAFSPDGTRVVTACADHTAQIWDSATGSRMGPQLSHGSGVTHAQFSSDGQHVVTASWDRTARVWETNTGRPVTLPLKHGGDVMYVAFSPGGHRIVTASTDLLVRVWDLADLNENSRQFPHSDSTWDAAFSATFSPDGHRVVTGGDDGSARVWEAATGKQVTPPFEHRGGVNHAAFSPDGRYVLTASADGTARVWDAVSGQPKGAPLNHGKGAVVHGSFSPDGQLVVTASTDGNARVWNLRTGSTTATFQHSGPVHVAWFSPDGYCVLTGSDDATARVWDAATAKPITPPLKHNSAVLYAAFSPDGHRVLTTSNDGTARVWDKATGEPTSPPLRHGQAIYHGSFSPDSARVVTASHDNTARVWDAYTGKPLTPPLGWQPSNVRYASFSPDGLRIATACTDGTARVWDAATGEPLTGALKHSNMHVVHAEFSPDGHLLLTASREGSSARAWDLLPDDRPIDDLALLAQVLCGHRIDATGGSLEPVEPGALREAWQRLRDKYPADFERSRRR